MPDRPLLIVGTGLFAQVARDYFEEFTDYRAVGFACHERYREADSVYGLPLVALESLPWSASKVDVFVAVGYRRMNKLRQAVYEEMKERGFRCATFVHPSVKVWPSTKLGDNVFVFEDNTLQPYTSIGNNTILWSGNHLGHHSSLGDHCFVSSHVVISGSCTVGNNVFLGVNSTLRDGLTIGDECLIGAGALLTKNARPKAVYASSPTPVFPKDSEQLGF